MIWAIWKISEASVAIKRELRHLASYCPGTARCQLKVTWMTTNPGTEWSDRAHSPGVQETILSDHPSLRNHRLNTGSAFTSGLPSNWREKERKETGWQLSQFTCRRTTEDRAHWCILAIPVQQKYRWTDFCDTLARQSNLIGELHL